MATSSSLAEAISALQRRYGAAAVRRGGDPVPAGVWATGLPVLDRLLDGGGLPLGRVAVLAGQGAASRGADGAALAASGRLTLLQALLAIASRSMQVAYVDLPGTLDAGYLADLGADLHSCLVVRPPRGAAGPGLALARTLVRAGVPWVGIALGPRPARAQTWEHPLTALAEAAWSTRAVVCFSAPAPLAAPLAYASSLTLGCAPLAWQEAHGDVVGLRVRLDVLKSKVGAPGASSAALLRYPRPHAVGDVVGLPMLLPEARPAALPQPATGRGAQLPALAG
ncbi:MAG TPA: hypothetical protein VN193_04715 [Candidatus Angelobacter sp.]|jgi:hypothetical protein|nr:hypothetical protein [Candidatus Angelobacter sp.]